MLPGGCKREMHLYAGNSPDSTHKLSSLDALFAIQSVNLQSGRETAQRIIFPLSSFAQNDDCGRCLKRHLDSLVDCRYLAQHIEKLKTKHQNLRGFECHIVNVHAEAEQERSSMWGQKTTEPA